MSKIVSYSERIRKARSLNDIVSVSKSIGFDIANIRANIRNSVSVSAEDFVIDTTRTVDTNPVRPKEVKERKLTLAEKREEERLDKERAASRKDWTISPIQAPASPIRLSPGVKVIGYKQPNIALITKHSKSMQVLHERSTSIETILAALEHTFSDAKGQEAALRGAKSVQKDVDSTYNSVAKELNAIAVKHAPQQLEDYAQAIQNQLIEVLDGSKYEHITLDLYVRAGDKVKTDTGASVVPVEFCYYTIINNLVLADDEGGEQPVEQYCIMLTGIVRDEMIRYFLNAVPEFLPPGTYPLGKEVVGDKELSSRLKLLMSIHKIVGDIGHRPMPYAHDSHRVTAIREMDSVEDVTVADESISVRLRPEVSDEVQDKLITDVKVLLTPINGNRKSSPVRAISTVLKSTIKDVALSFAGSLPDIKLVRKELTAIPDVSRVVASKSAITVSLHDGRRANRVTKMILAILAGAKHEGDTPIESSVIKKPRTVVDIKFTLVGKTLRGEDSDVGATKSQLDELQHALGLTTRETSDIKRILIKHRG